MTVLKRAFTIALVGNPNTGKSTLFNRLTGIRQRIGNYPGVTVEKKMGTLRHGDRSFQVIDLPGTYSLAASSLDERVVVDSLAGNFDDRPDAVVCVVDATNLDRNLFLVSQTADLELPMVIALNMSDSAREQEIEIDTDLLSERLGVPVIPTVASDDRGIDELKKAISDAVENPQKLQNLTWPESIQTATAELRRELPTQEENPLTDAEIRRLIFDSNSAVRERLDSDPEEVIRLAREELRASGLHPFAAETVLRYDFIGKTLDGVVKHPTQRKVTRTEKIDRVLTHRFFGLLIFLGMMFIVFQSVYTWATPFMDWIDEIKGTVQETVGGMLTTMPHVQSLVVDGVIEGVGSVLIFLPQILILFLFIAILEDSGYMARAAFLMDKLLSWCGLNGKSFVPLLSSYACAIPGVMAARTIEDPKSRLTTILIAPLMSCSARLPVYVLLIGAFIEPVYGPWIAGLVLFAMHFVGLIVAIPVAVLINKFLIKGKSQPFILEMPPYRRPKVRDIFWRMWERGREFVIRAGTIIFAITIIIWVLLYFPRPESVEQEIRDRVAVEVLDSGIEDNAYADILDNRIAGAYLEQSYMGRIGHALQPIFAPAGFDWKITVGVIASFPAREVIIATLGIIYNLGGDVDEESSSLRENMAREMWTDGSRTGTPVFTIPVVIAIMFFFALCMQCGATLAIIAKESRWSWAVFTFFYMTALAWVGAVICYQIGSALM